jgi:hypothetical protein
MDGQDLAPAARAESNAPTWALEWTALSQRLLLLEPLQLAPKFLTEALLARRLNLGRFVPLGDGVLARLYQV